MAKNVRPTKVYRNTRSTRAQKAKPKKTFFSSITKGIKAVNRIFYFIKIWHPSQTFAWIIVPAVYMIPSFTWLVIWNLYTYISSGKALFDIYSALLFSGINFLIAIALVWKALYIGKANTTAPLIGPLGFVVEDYSLKEGWNILFIGYKPVPNRIYQTELKTFNISVTAYDQSGRAYLVTVLFSARVSNAYRVFRSGIGQTFEVFLSSAKACTRASFGKVSNYKTLLSRDMVNISPRSFMTFKALGISVPHAVITSVNPLSQATASLIERTANISGYLADSNSVKKMLAGYIKAGMPKDIASQLIAERQNLRRVLDSNFRLSGSSARGGRVFLDGRHHDH